MFGKKNEPEAVKTALTATLTLNGEAAGSVYYDLWLSGTATILANQAPVVFVPGVMTAMQTGTQVEYKITPDHPGHVLVQVGNVDNWSPDIRRATAKALYTLVNGEIVKLSLSPFIKVIPSVVNISTGPVLKVLP
jgi:hypothetical protein